MGLRELKVQVHLWAHEQKHIKGKTHRRKNAEVYQEQTAPRHRLGGLYSQIRTGRIFKARLCQDYHRRQAIRRQYYILSLYSKTRSSTIASGVLPSGALAAHPDEILTCIKEAEKANEDLDSLNTTIEREFILFKVRQPEDFLS
jgi:hypothetical protein